MLTYHDIDMIEVEADQFLMELFDELEQTMLADRASIPVEVVNGGQTTGSNSPNPAGG